MRSVTQPDGSRDSPPPEPARRRLRPVVTDVRGLVIETVVVCGLIILAYAMLPLDGENRWVGVTIGVLVILSVIPVVTRRIRRVLRADRPLSEAIGAIIVTATVAVIGSSGVYFAMARADPGQFDGLGTKVDGVYFAVTVMTTTGFGDIVATSQVARLVTTLHIVFTVALLGAAFRLIAWATKRRLSTGGRIAGQAVEGVGGRGPDAHRASDADGP
jgi:hypothetical protein